MLTTGGSSDMPMPVHDTEETMRVESLGKRALFLIPSVKVYNRKYSKSRQNVARTIHNFLKDTFAGYTCASGNIYGYFTSESTEYDELREFRVAFREDAGRTKVSQLQRFLAALCEDVGEECIHLECGEDAMLVYPSTIREWCTGPLHGIYARA